MTAILNHLPWKHLPWIGGVLVFLGTLCIAAYLLAPRAGPGFLLFGLKAWPAIQFDGEKYIWTWSDYRNAREGDTLPEGFVSVGKIAGTTKKEITEDNQLLWAGRCPVEAEVFRNPDNRDVIYLLMDITVKPDPKGNGHPPEHWLDAYIPFERQKKYHER